MAKFLFILKGLLLDFIIFITYFLPNNILSFRIRGFLISPFLGSCGKNLRIGRSVTLYRPEKIFIGDNVYISMGNWLFADKKIIIEDEVMFGPYSIIVDSNHSMMNKSYRYGKHYSKKITIRKGSWIGAKCCILPGSDIGKGVLVSAGAVLAKKVPDYAVVGGNPAKVIKLNIPE